MVRINWTPTEGQLRRFGWVGLVVIPLMGWAATRLAPDSEALGIALVAGALALVFGVFAGFSPTHLKPFYLLVDCVRAGLFFPVALVRWLCGRRGADRTREGDFGGNGGNIPEDGPPDTPEN